MAHEGPKQWKDVAATNLSRLTITCHLLVSLCTMLSWSSIDRISLTHIIQIKHTHTHTYMYLRHSDRHTPMLCKQLAGRLTYTLHLKTLLVPFVYCGAGAGGGEWWLLKLLRPPLAQVPNDGFVQRSSILENKRNRNRTLLLLLKSEEDAIHCLFE